MRLADQPHHDGSNLHVSTSCPRLGESVTLWLRAPAAAGITAVHARVTPDGEPWYRPAWVDTARPGPDTWWRVEIEATNPVSGYRFHLTFADGGIGWLTAAGLVHQDLPDATDFKLIAYEAPPSWSADAVIYQIFPDRFARSAAAGPVEPPDWAIPCDWDTEPVIGAGPGVSQQLYGGDLDGIAERLDHIASLGANTVYLTPFFPARSNHRYDASSFDEVDPLLGGDDALRRLADAVHARGMRLIGDITANHCGAAHAWFRAALADRAAPEREMFYFDADGGYESWCGVASLPKLNWNSALTRSRMIAVLQRWLGTPDHPLLDGWRVDVANMTGRRGADDLTLEVATLLRRAVTEVRPDAMFVGEHMHDGTIDLDADGWHGTMNYGGFTRPIWTWLRGEGLSLPWHFGAPGGVPARDGHDMLAAIRAFGGQLSWRSLTRSWQLLDSHDTARIRTVTGSAGGQVVAVGLQATLPGTPMIFAGSEFGLSGWNGEHSRTPMPWDRPDDIDAGTLTSYQRLFGLRRAEPALRHGGLRWLHVSADTLVFLRETESESLLILARRAADAAVPLPIDGIATAVFGAEDLTPVDGVLTLPAGGPGFRVWRV
jgi:alpha-glucosidase